MRREGKAPGAATWPGPCEVCRSWARGGLCEACLARFAPPRLRCLRCALPVEDDPATPRQRGCDRCAADSPPWTLAAAALDYGFPWDGLIAQFKFHGRAELAAVLARLLAQAVRSLPTGRGPDGDGAIRPELVLSVPLSQVRLAERGYNQAWELARRVAEALGLRADATLLQRPVDTPHLAELSRPQRARSLEGAFMVEPARAHTLRGRHVALVDDIWTSGATLREGCRALRQAGAATVQVWALARTPAA